MMRALVVGRSRGAMDEYRAARALCPYDFVIVIGKMGEVFPDRIDYWVSFHANLFDKWAATRAANGHPPAAHYWGAVHKGRRLGEAATHCSPISFVPSVGGSSGFVAAQGALRELAVDRVVLAGIPMSAEESHFADASTAREAAGTWSEAGMYWATWEDHMPEMLGRVKSMSGRTRVALGAPTRAWLEGL